jgi:Anti-sigma factor NepR
LQREVVTKRGPPQPPNGKTPATPAAPIHDYIGRKLKGMFDEVVSEPVPDKLRALLEELERKSGR